MSSGDGVPSGIRGAAAVVDHAEHTPYSDPGAYDALVMALPTEPAELSAVARNVIVHYRASGHELPEEFREEINSRSGSSRSWPPTRGGIRVRWTRRGGDQPCAGVLSRPHAVLCGRAPVARHAGEVASRFRRLLRRGVAPRSRRCRGVAGRAVAALRLRGRRTAGESVDADGHRPESPGGSGFVTAAQAWAAYRRGDIDADVYGVDPDMPVFRGPRFVFDEVIYEVAHRFGDELLLWDAWGRIGEPGSPVSDEDARWIDEVAALLLAADAGDLAAEHRLLARYRVDEGLHPGATVLQGSPFGADPIPVALRSA